MAVTMSAVDMQIGGKKVRFGGEGLPDQYRDISPCNSVTPEVVSYV